MHLTLTEKETKYALPKMTFLMVVTCCEFHMMKV